MNEITFITEDAKGLEGAEMTQYLKERLRYLADLADKLSADGWSVQLTIRGLAFQPPEGPADTQKAAEAMQERLKQLGIPDLVRPWASHSIDDLEMTEDEYSDRAWYEQADRVLRDRSTGLCCCCEDSMIKRMKQLEEWFGRRGLMVADDYERGMLHGKIQAMRWMLGDSWDDLDEVEDLEDSDELECPHVDEILEAE